jgi:hypothetical protein
MQISYIHTNGGFHSFAVFGFYAHHCVRSGHKSMEGVLKHLEKYSILAGIFFTA